MRKQVLFLFVEQIISRKEEEKKNHFTGRCPIQPDILAGRGIKNHSVLYSNCKQLSGAEPQISASRFDLVTGLEPTLDSCWSSSSRCYRRSPPTSAKTHAEETRPASRLDNDPRQTAAGAQRFSHKTAHLCSTQLMSVVIFSARLLLSKTSQSS